MNVPLSRPEPSKAAPAPAAGAGSPAASASPDEPAAGAEIGRGARTVAELEAWSMGANPE